MSYYCMLDPKCPGNHESKYEMCWGTTRAERLALAAAAHSHKERVGAEQHAAAMAELRAEIGRLSGEFLKMEAESNTLRSRLDEARKWMQHERRCRYINSAIGGIGEKCTCGLDAFLEGGKPPTEWPPTNCAIALWNSVHVRVSDDTCPVAGREKPQGEPAPLPNLRKEDRSSAPNSGQSDGISRCSNCGRARHKRSCQEAGETLARCWEMLGGKP